jgi:RNA polymerase sigma-70 factor (ECF subfamily)
LGTTPTYTESELVMMLKDRDNKSFSYLYNNYSGALYTIVLQIIPDEEMASDVLQEVFINIWRKIESYDPSKGRLFTWMLNIARNASIDFLRSRAYQNSKKNQEFPASQELNVPGQAIQMNTDDIGLKKVLLTLKTESRVLIDLAYFKGYTHEEIAEIEEIPLGTVKTRIRTALKQLREHLK